MTKQTKFILAIAVQLAIISAIIVFKVAIFIGGADILLKIEPVDPRDPLRGDYVTFRYGISSLSPHLFRGEPIRKGDTVYVTLGRIEKYWLAQNVQKTKPTGDNPTFLKGRVLSGGVESPSGPSPAQHPASSSIHVVYGIEEYFIPEGRGRNFSPWNKEVAARVSVDKNGNAVLKQLYVDDKPWP